VLYYSFDKNAGDKIADESGLGNDGRAHGAKWTPKGKVGGAYTFDGMSDYISATGYKGVLGQRPMSISAWARSDGYTRGGQYIVAWGDGREVGGAFFTCYRGDGDHCIMGAVGGQNVFGGNAPQADGLWHHVCLSTDGKVVSLYVDGQFVKAETPPGGMNVKGNEDVSIGQSWGSSSLKGAIDEVMIYDRALSEQEVKQLHCFGNMLPAGEGSIAFGGVNWMPLRHAAEVQGDKLVTLPRARAGFNYGHGGSGRGSWLMTNIGSEQWKDYSVEFEFCMPEMAGGAIMVHVVDFKESWNENGWSTYYISVGADGSMGLSCMYNMYCHVPSGHGDMRADCERPIATGKGVKIDPKNGNKFRIDVRGISIKVWVDGTQILDAQDEKMGETIGGKTLDHGGVGFSWTHDSTGWIRNFSAKRLGE
ncbi:MAG: LamG domain-containing protein, partial [bacterium]